MKINFKKIATVLGSALMIGSTLGIAAAANYPAPFVQSGQASVAIVYGQNAAPLDVAGAANIASNLATALAAQTATGGSVSGASASGGDSINLATSARKLYYGDSINAAKTSLSETEMPNVLKDGTFMDLSGTQYDYSQTITLGDTVSIFDTSGGDLDDPILNLAVGTTATDPLYNYTLSFNKNVNVSDTTNVQGQKINILGVDYVIGSSSTNTTLYLYGSGETITVAGGESNTVNIGGTDHIVELVTTDSATTATIVVDGVSRSVTEGSSYAFSGDINVYVKDVINPQFAGDIRRVELIMGANTLKLVTTQTVKQGADETSVKNTLVTITAAGHGQISGVTISVAAEKSDLDSLIAGESFSDPVFGGLKVNFVGAVPALDSTSRGKIKVDTDNNQYAYVTFTSARAGTTGEQRLIYAYDNATSASLVAPLLAHKTVSSNGQGVIHVVEGESALENDWIVINQGDAGTILEVSDISIDSGTSGTVTFEDVITGASQTITLTNSSNVYTKSGVNFFGGNGYTISTPGAGTSVNITWNSGATAVFPRIKLKDGGWIAFLASTNVSNDTSIILPNGLTTLSTLGDGGRVNGSLSKIVNGINWTYAGSGVNNSNTTINGIATPTCSFNVTMGPAILFMEPMKWNDASNGNLICVPMTTAGTTEIAIARAVLNGSNSGFQTLTSDTYKSEAVDEYGALVSDEQRTNENGVATISYPSSQMFLDVLFSAEGATITGGSSSGGTATSLGAVTVSDSEAASVSGKNMVVIGGSCINSVAASLLGGALCGDAFTTSTGVAAGEFLIQSFDKSGKVALLVAGYNAADTQKAVTYLTNQAVDTTLGKKYKGTSATEATLVTTTA